MANIILPNTKTINTETVNGVEKDVIKDKPSLFDSLLKESVSQKEEIPTQNKVDKNIVNEKAVDIVAVVKKDENQTVLENTKSQSSLLDRLVVEVKQELKDNQEVLKIPNEEVIKEEITTQSVDTEAVVKKDENSAVLENTKTINTETVNGVEKDEIKDKPSLFDSLLKESVSQKEEIVTEKSIDTVTVKKDEFLTTDKTVELVNEKSVDVLETTKQDDLIIEKTVQLTNTTILPDGVVEKENVIVAKEILPLENVSKNNAISENLISENKTKNEKNKSLMDLLIQKSIEKSGIVVVNESVETVDDSSSNKDLLSNMYLGNQKNVVNNQLLFNKNEAMQLLKEGSTLKDIEKSANLLELGLDNVDVEKNIGIDTLEVVKKQEIEMLGRKSFLDKLMFEKNIKSDEIKNIITQSVEASKALVENTLNINEDVVVNVNSPLSYNIQSKIIGAKQQMSTMMSDIARQMYENYKPPVTVFKLNLNPLELGSISILMKNDKNNALTISMNVSNMTTLDALIDNQNILKSALNKTFDENTKFNLDFNSSNQNNNQSSNNGQNNQNGRFEQQMDTQSVLQLKEENKEVEEKILDYM